MCSGIPVKRREGRLVCGGNFELGGCLWSVVVGGTFEVVEKLVNVA